MEIFPVGFCCTLERNKEKTPKFTRTIYLRKYKTRVINDLLETHLKHQGSLIKNHLTDLTVISLQRHEQINPFNG